MGTQPINIRAFEPRDADAVSVLIRQTMAISNSQDYDPARLQPLIDYFTPAKVLQLSQERYCIVAEAHGVVVGTAALDGVEIATFFVHPGYQGRGIGAQLLARLESAARALGITALVVDSSITGAAFYRRMGFIPNGERKQGTAGPQVHMEKCLAVRCN
jgi:N-acetylglutamate synthase-like GNAT family acetyltransferase